MLDIPVMPYDRKEYRSFRKYSLTQIHDLWYKFEKRKRERNLILCDYINQIAKEIPANSKKEHIVYYDRNGRTNQYTFRKSSDFPGHYSYSDEPVKYVSREASLDFFLSNEKQFEMGKEFRKIYLKTSSNFTFYLREVFSESLQKHLRDKVNNDFFWHNKILTVKIGDKKHWVKATRKNGYYIEYEYISEAIEEIIELK
jgi:hypothetical protein